MQRNAISYNKKYLIMLTIISPFGIFGGCQDTVTSLPKTTNFKSSGGECGPETSLNIIPSKIIKKT